MNLNDCPVAQLVTLVNQSSLQDFNFALQKLDAFLSRRRNTNGDPVTSGSIVVAHDGSCS